MTKANGRLIPCVICGKEFYVAAYRLAKGVPLCCSTACLYQQRGDRKIGRLTTCEACGAEVYRLPSADLKGKRVFCSAVCRKSKASEFGGRPKQGTEIACVTCGGLFYAIGSAIGVRNHCSVRCRADDPAYRALRQDRVTKSCAKCGQSYVVIRSRERGSHYCSRECQGAAKRVDEIPCERCGKRFARRRSPSGFSHRKFCSWECARTGRQVACEVCGKLKYVTPSNMLAYAHHYCSARCFGLDNARNRQIARPTTIELMVREALTELGLAFEPEFHLRRYLVDAFVPSLQLAIEVQGDYWHANPAKYPNGPVSVVQKKHVARDVAKHAAIRADGYQLIELWECDLRARGAEALLRELLPEYLPVHTAGT